MASKAIFACASLLFVQNIAAQCTGRNIPVIGSSGSGTVSGSSTNNGGAFVVTSAGPVAPSGISVATDAIQLIGNLAVDGQLPFLSAVALEGAFPTSGAASVAYGCGDGNVGITQEVGNPCVSNAPARSGISLANLANVRQ